MEFYGFFIYTLNSLSSVMCLVLEICGRKKLRAYKFWKWVLYECKCISNRNIDNWGKPYLVGISTTLQGTNWLISSHSKSKQLNYSLFNCNKIPWYGLSTLQSQIRKRNNECFKSHVLVYFSFNVNNTWIQKINNIAMQDDNLDGF